MPSSRSNTFPHNHTLSNRTRTRDRPHQFRPCVWQNGSDGEGHVDGRALVLCFDDTSDKFDSTNSNVARLFSMLAKGNPERQMVYYQAGVGTYSSSPFRRAVARTVDMIFATTLKNHVIDGYNFLMQHYKKNDKICIFGFSRGALQARILAGMLYKVGLLTAGNFQQVPFAYKLYCDDTVKGWSESLQFKRTFSLNVDIEFVGVWDTVASIGMSSRHLPLTRANPAIKTFRHGVALDEHRIKFTPNLYESNEIKSPRPEVAMVQSDSTDKSDEKPPARCTEKTDEEVRREDLFWRICAYNMMKEARSFAKRFSNMLASTDETVADTFDMLEECYSNRPAETDVLEVWFAGCHCDVGGGNVPNSTKHSLANIPLRWMIRQCLLADAGILFECNKLRAIGIEVDPLTGKPLPHPLCKSDLKDLKGNLPRADMEQSESTACHPDTLTCAIGDLQCNDANAQGDAKAPQEMLVCPEVNLQSNETNARGYANEDYLDATCPMYDQLELNRPWWIADCLPLVVIDWHDKKDAPSLKVAQANFGRPWFKTHKPPMRSIKVHDSVKLRMETLGYTPRVRLEDPIWVH